MYPDNAFYEFYPAEIVDKVISENPGVTVERLHQLMQAEFEKAKRAEPWKYELAEYLG